MLIQLIVGLIVIGVLLWLVNTYLPMDGKIKSILNVAVVIGVVLWVLQAFGILMWGSPLTNLIVGLAVLGVLLFFINSYIPMDGKIKNIINVVFVLIAILAVLQAFGVLPAMHVATLR